MLRSQAKQRRIGSSPLSNRTRPPSDAKRTHSRLLPKPTVRSTARRNLSATPPPSSPEPEPQPQSQPSQPKTRRAKTGIWPLTAQDNAALKATPIGGTIRAQTALRFVPHTCDPPARNLPFKPVTIRPNDDEEEWRSLPLGPLANQLVSAPDSHHIPHFPSELSPSDTSRPAAARASQTVSWNPIVTQSTVPHELLIRRAPFKPLLTNSTDADPSASHPSQNTELIRLAAQSRSLRITPATTSQAPQRTTPHSQQQPAPPLSEPLGFGSGPDPFSSLDLDFSQLLDDAPPSLIASDDTLAPLVTQILLTLTQSPPLNLDPLGLSSEFAAVAKTTRLSPEASAAQVFLLKKCPTGAWALDTHPVGTDHSSRIHTGLHEAVLARVKLAASQKLAKKATQATQAGPQAGLLASDHTDQTSSSIPTDSPASTVDTSQSAIRQVGAWHVASNPGIEVDRPTATDATTTTATTTSPPPSARPQRLSFLAQPSLGLRTRPTLTALRHAVSPTKLRAGDAGQGKDNPTSVWNADTNVDVSTNDDDTDPYGYQITQPSGLFNSLERELYDAVSAGPGLIGALTKAHIAQLDGTVIAYHDDAGFHGFQTISRDDMGAVLLHSAESAKFALDSALRLSGEVLTQILSDLTDPMASFRSGLGCGDSSDSDSRGVSSTKSNGMASTVRLSVVKPPRNLGLLLVAETFPSIDQDDPAAVDAALACPHRGCVYAGMLTPEQALGALKRRGLVPQNTQIEGKDETNDSPNDQDIENDGVVFQKNKKNQAQEGSKNTTDESGPVSQDIGAPTQTTLSPRAVVSMLERHLAPSDIDYVLPTNQHFLQLMDQGLIKAYDLTIGLFDEAAGHHTTWRRIHNTNPSQPPPKPAPDQPPVLKTRNPPALMASHAAHRVQYRLKPLAHLTTQTLAQHSPPPPSPAAQLEENKSQAENDLISPFPKPVPLSTTKTPLSERFQLSNHLVTATSQFYQQPHYPSISFQQETALLQQLTRTTLRHSDVIAVVAAFKPAGLDAIADANQALPDPGLAELTDHDKAIANALSPPQRVAFYIKTNPAVRTVMQQCSQRQLEIVSRRQVSAAAVLADGSVAAQASPSLPKSVVPYVTQAVADKFQTEKRALEAIKSNAELYHELYPRFGRGQRPLVHLRDPAAAAAGQPATTESAVQALELAALFEALKTDFVFAEPVAHRFAQRSGKTKAGASGAAPPQSGRNADASASSGTKPSAPVHLVAKPAKATKQAARDDATVQQLDSDFIPLPKPIAVRLDFDRLMKQAVGSALGPTVPVQARARHKEVDPVLIAVQQQQTERKDAVL